MQGSFADLPTLMVPAVERVSRECHLSGFGLE